MESWLFKVNAFLGLDVGPDVVYDSHLLSRYYFQFRTI